jgi:hypothetical protein
MAPSTQKTRSSKSSDPRSWLERLWASLAVRGSVDAGRPGAVVPLYARDAIEANHEALARDGVVARSAEVDVLMAAETQSGSGSSFVPRGH